MLLLHLVLLLLPARVCNELLAAFFMLARCAAAATAAVVPPTHTCDRDVFVDIQGVEAHTCDMSDALAVTVSSHSCQWCWVSCDRGLAHCIWVAGFAACLRSTRRRESNADQGFVLVTCLNPIYVVSRSQGVLHDKCVGWIAHIAHGAEAAVVIL